MILDLGSIALWLSWSFPWQQHGHAGRCRH
jgi:hypothetical protein